MTNLIDVTAATTKELLEFFNANSEKQVKRFADRKTAERRVNQLIDSMPAQEVELEPAQEVELEPEADDRGRAKPAPSEVRSAAMVASWTNPEVAAKRATRHFVRVDGVEYRSVRAAFLALNLPLKEHIKFRMELKAEGQLNAYRRSWEAIENA